MAGAIGDLSEKSCVYADGAWNFTGTLKNSQQEAQLYSVQVLVSNTKTTSVVASQVLSEKLDAGKSAKLDKKAIIKTKDNNGLSCTVSVIRKKV